MEELGGRCGEGVVELGGERGCSSCCATPLPLLVSQSLSADHTYTAIACTPHLTTFTRAYNLGLEIDQTSRCLVFNVG